MNISIILSGGIGSRMGLDIPKQYFEINGNPIIYYCTKTFVENSNINALVIAVAEEWKDYVELMVSHLQVDKPIFYCEPGDTRQMTIFNALRRLQIEGCKEDDIVIIHDAARPLLSHELINKCIGACYMSDCVMPVIPIKDTVYYSNDGTHINSLLNRNCLWAGQAPEAFRFGIYLSAHETMSREELLRINGSTELAYKAGLKCQMIEGDPMNFKITTHEDLSNFESIINRQNL